MPKPKLCYVKTVHGDIRHLEKAVQALDSRVTVHGDIRHLENWSASQVNE